MSREEKQPLTPEQAMTEAERCAADKTALPQLLRRAARKAARHREILRDPWDCLVTLFRMVRAWKAGKYAPPKTTVLMAVAALIYFVEPFDLIPDSIPVLGFVDDGSLVTSVVAANLREVLKFRQWEGT